MWQIKVAAILFSAEIVKNMKVIKFFRYIPCKDFSIFDMLSNMNCTSIDLHGGVLVVRNGKIMTSGIFALIRLSLFTELAKIKYEQMCTYEQKR